MEQVLYTSRATEHVSSTNLFSIIEVSARNNPGREVTGFLIATGSEFLQLVEGPTERLDELLAVLHRDNRHRDIRILMRNSIQKRSFPSWRMQRFDAVAGSPNQVLSVLSDKKMERNVLREVESFLLSHRKAA